LRKVQIVNCEKLRTKTLKIENLSKIENRNKLESLRTFMIFEDMKIVPNVVYKSLRSFKSCFFFQKYL